MLFLYAFDIILEVIVRNVFMESNFDFLKSLDLFQFAVLNPQMAMISFLEIGQKLASRPKVIENAQKDLFDRLIELQKSFVKEICSNDDKYINLKYDERKNVFEDNAFENLPILLFARKFHETMAQWLLDTIDSLEDVDPKLLHSVRFFAKQYLDMMSPDNFPFLNPNVLKEAFSTNGANFIKGFEILLNDIMQGAISTTDREQFEVGKNLATTTGKVIFQNDIIELIQYEPTTPKVFAKPILFVPPWINKFYILDLNSESSFVKWAVDKGFTVFMISWVNPDKRYRNKGFEDYANYGLSSALNKIHEATKSKSVHAVGYCVGGTLISAFLAYLASPLCQKRPKTRIESATLLTTLLDFSHAGDMAVFMAENYLDAIKAQMKEKGYLDGNVMYNTFSALKAKDMIWRYFINSYMLGKKPPAHDILYWNSDPTNLTEAMQTFLAKDLYRDNLLKTGTLKMYGVPLDLSRINIPLYMISMQKDHLVPWKATFDNLKFLRNNVRFVLGGSGHVAGVVNPPSRNKYCYWVNDRITENAQDWLDTATQIAGSWWNDWFDWLQPMMGAMVHPPAISKYLREAPGVYVKNQTPEKVY